MPALLSFASGYLSDRTGRYWAITLVGYAVNLAAVLLLALAGRWEIAACLSWPSAWERRFARRLVPCWTRLSSPACSPAALIPVFYAVAIGMDALGALLSLFFAPLVFFGGKWTVLAGMALWGLGMGAQESIMRAKVADIVPADSG